MEQEMLKAISELSKQVWVSTIFIQIMILVVIMKQGGGNNDE